MTAFRIFLIVVLVSIIGYTTVTILNHGLNLLPIFFGDMAEMGWPGQFNFDFMCFLMLSAIWVAWRNHFTAKGLGLAVLAFFGGMFFLSIYLLILSFRSNGNIESVLLGPSRA